MVNLCGGTTDNQGGNSILRHCDTGFTLCTYTHATRQMQDRAAETMGNFMTQMI